MSQVWEVNMRRWILTLLLSAAAVAAIAVAPRLASWRAFLPASPQALPLEVPVPIVVVPVTIPEIPVVPAVLVPPPVVPVPPPEEFWRDAVDCGMG